jgi:hypothetical protein
MMKEKGVEIIGGGPIEIPSQHTPGGTVEN